jgi:hypothetical protein
MSSQSRFPINSGCSSEEGRDRVWPCNGRISGTSQIRGVSFPCPEPEHGSVLGIIAALFTGLGIRIGLLITLIASVMYVTAWMVYSHFISPDTMAQMLLHKINEIKGRGASAAEINAQLKQMQQFREYGKNPLIEMAITFIKIFPIGLLISVICSAILKRKTAAREVNMA